MTFRFACVAADAVVRFDHALAEHLIRAVGVAQWEAQFSREAQAEVALELSCRPGKDGSGSPRGGGTICSSS